jgi:16S rRNA (uracil1498-N3)-methyltransferase
MKQSFKFNLPVLNKIQKFEDFIVQRDEKIKLIATCDEYKKQELKNVYSNNTKNLIMIGPEGDFTEKEVKNSINNKFNLVSLGNSRLRAETAGIYACTAFSLIK